MTDQELVKKHEGSPVGHENMRSTTRYMTPTVDILETDETLVLYADLPGVDKNDLEINLEKGLLTIVGQVRPTPRGETLFREFGTANYYRQFQVSEHFDTEKTSAELKNGVLTLTLPKAEAAKPKRIEIRQQ